MRPRVSVAASVVLPLMMEGGLANAQSKRLTNFRPPVHTFDVFIGQNKKGPYALSWTNIRADRDDTFDVVVDGVPLSRNLYDVDGKKGNLTFRTDLKSTSVVRVDYTYDPPVAKRSTTSTFPLSASLYEIGNTALNVTILPQTQNDKGNNPLVVWGLGQKARLLGGGLTSNLYLSPDAPGTGTVGLPDRAGLTLAYVLGSDRTGLNAGFTRTGRGFSPDAGKMFNLGNPAQRISLGLHNRISNWVGLNANLAQIRDLKGNGAQTLNGFGVTLGMSPKRLALAYNRDTADTTDATGTATKTTTDKVNINAPVNPNTQVSAKAQRSLVDSDVKASSQSGQDMAVTVVTASKDKSQQLSVAVSGGTKDSTTTNVKNQNVDVTVQPGKNLTISGGLGNQTTTAVGTPGAMTGVETHTQTTKAVVTPLTGVKVTASLQKNIAPVVTTTIGDIGGEAKFGKVEAAAGYTNRASTNRDTTQGGTAALNSTRARLALRPTGTLTVTSGLTLNPNDDQGNAFAATRQEYGLTTKLGILDVGSGYSLTTRSDSTSVPAGSSAQFGELSVNVGLHFSTWTNLTGSYKDSFLYGAAVPGGLRSYGLGLTHTLGSGFNFSLNGTMTEDRTQIGRPADVKGEAKVGIRF